MKQSKLTVIILCLITLFTACKKEPAEKPIPVPIPGPGQATNVYRLEVENLVGITSPQSGLYAIASVINEQGVEVVSNKKLPLSFNGRYTSENLQLPSGKYKLVKFILFGNDNKVQYAAPLTGSEKAPGVSKPLAIAFKVPNDSALKVGVEVVGVLPGEAPVKFGYPAGSFSESGNAPDTNPFFKIKLRTVISNGGVIYDSIPSSLRLTVWNERNEMTMTNHDLAPGVNEITVPKASTKFTFQIWQWGHTDQMTLLKKDVDSNTIYMIGGGREAKKLRSEVSATLGGGTPKQESKKAYSYGANGKLDKVTYYLKRADGTPYLAFTDVFNYTGDRVATIVKSDENGTPVSSTIFQYNTQGKIVSIKQKDNANNETRATVTYVPMGGSYQIQAKYTYSNTTNELNYNMTMLGGNMVETASATTNMSSETGHYQYDFQINPYANMGWPDLYFSHQSKNNVIGQQKSYTGNFPTADPYKFEYKYDDYGYPVELIKSFKSPVTSQHLFSTKTVFYY